MDHGVYSSKIKETKLYMLIHILSDVISSLPCWNRTKFTPIEDVEKRTNSVDFGLHTPKSNVAVTVVVLYK